MKRAVIFLSFFASLYSAKAQLLLDTWAFSATGVTGVAIQGHLEFWKNSPTPTSTTGTLKLYLDNLSVHEKLNHTLTGHEDGILTGFGFNVASGFNYVSNSFTEALTGPIAGLATGSEPYGIDFSRSGSFSAGSESFQAGAFAEEPLPRHGLSGGYAALFTFNFSASNSAYVTNKFNADNFFADTDQKDLYFRFQSVSNNGCGTELSDKVFIGFTDELPPTPEPSTYGLFGVVALFGVVLWRRSKKQLARN